VTLSVTRRRAPGAVVIAGSLAQKPGIAGHTWQFLQYLLGFRRLGWEVLFVDRLEPTMCIDADGRPCGLDESFNLRYFLDVMTRFELDDAFSLLCGGARTIGWSRSRVAERARDAVFLVNVMGYLTDEQILGAARRRVFLDTDPGVAQMWKALGLADVFRNHDDFVTIGENIGRPDCPIPTCGLQWQTFHQPVVLDCWPAVPPPFDAAFTSVATWRGTYSPIEYGGHTYGQRVHEFRKYFGLPALTGQKFTVALDIHGSETRDRESLSHHGWTLLEPRAVAGDPWRYRYFIQSSRAEFMVAKSIVVETNSGWFSDRTMCYLASGRPALVQDTGLAGLYPTGRGLLTFRTPDEAAAAIEALCSDYGTHARAAREMAAEYFDSDRVLTNLLVKLGVA
jgi:hypothetical protein